MRPRASDPGVGGVQLLELEVAGAHPADLLGPDQPAALEHLQVLMDGGQGDRKRRGQLADRGRPPGEPLDDRAAGRVGEGLEHEVQLARILKHVPKYRDGAAEVKSFDLRRPADGRSTSRAAAGCCRPGGGPACRCRAPRERPRWRSRQHRGEAVGADEVVADESADDRADPAEQNGGQHADVLTPGDHQAGQAADDDADDPDADDRPQRQADERQDDQQDDQDSEQCEKHDSR